MAKDAAIIEALDYLRRRLGDTAFVPVDHWEADLTATGIAQPLDPTRLVYIACRRHAPPRYTAVLERRPAPGSALPYEQCGHFEDLDLDGLAAIVSTHLAD